MLNVLGEKLIFALRLNRIIYMTNPAMLPRKAAQEKQSQVVLTLPLKYGYTL